MSDVKEFTNAASAEYARAVNSVPEGWTSAELSDFCDTVGGGTPDRSVEEYWNGEIPWASPTEITTRHTKYISKTKESITLRGLEKSSAKLHPPGTVLMTSRASIGYVAINTVPMATNQGFQSLRCKKNALADYIYQYITWIRPELERMSAGSTFSEISSSSVKRLRATLPPLPEQKKIAAILSSVDEVIEKTRAQTDKLKDLKTGMMQELLTKGIGPGGVPHTEFKDSPVGRIPAGWEVSPLNQLVTIKHGYAFEGAYFRSVPTPYLLLTPGNFNKDGRLYFGPKTKYYDGPVPEDFILKNGDVLVVMTDLTKEMTILGNTIILKSPNTVLHNQRIGKVVSLKENILLPDYLCMIMNSDRVKSHIKDTATGTTVRHTSPTKILEPLIPIPSISEQAKIADIFRALNDKVALVESKLAAHEIIKKALMQDLLTGKVRVQIDTHELAEA